MTPPPPCPRPRGLTCPNCRTKLAVRRIYHLASGVVRRRRICKTCNYHLSTVEQPVSSPGRP